MAQPNQGRIIMRPHKAAQDNKGSNPNHGMPGTNPQKQGSPRKSGGNVGEKHGGTWEMTSGQHSKSPIAGRLASSNEGTYHTDVTDMVQGSPGQHMHPKNSAPSHQDSRPSTCSCELPLSHED